MTLISNQNASKWLYFAATFMFAAATFQVVDGKWLPTAFFFALATACICFAKKYQKAEVDKA